MRKLFVLADRHMWMTPLPGRIVGQHNTALRGDEIEVSDEEADRGIALGVLSPNPIDLVTAESEAGEPRTWVDEQLLGANVDDLVAYMGQRPSEAERVLELENARSRKRKTVLEAAERIIDARDAELERQADVVEQDAADAAARAAAGGAPVVPASV